MKRADWAVQQLQNSGVSSSLLQAKAGEIELSDQMSIVKRRVEFNMDIKQ